MESSSDGLAQQINVRKTEFLYYQAPFSCIGNGVALALILAAYWKTLPLLPLALWATAATILLLGRWRGAKAFKKRDRYADISQWYQRYNNNATCNGLSWGALVAYAASQLAAPELVVLMMVLGVLLTASSVAYNSYMRLYCNFALPAALPAALLLFSRGQPQDTAVAAVIICWLILMISFAHQVSGYLGRTASYEFTNIALLRELHIQQEHSRILQEEIELKRHIIEALAQRERQHSGHSTSPRFPAPQLQ
ncbi:MAG: hypothetical protein AB8B86_10780 [Pseudomonadales bacterium]